MHLVCDPTSLAVTALLYLARDHLIACDPAHPADPERRSVLSDFAPVPYAPLPYRSVVVASSNDPFCPVRLAGAYARAWGSEFVRLQSAGHINIESGHGEWPLGWALLQSLLAPTGAELGDAAGIGIAPPLMVPNVGLL